MDEGVNNIATHEPPLPGSGFGRTEFWDAGFATSGRRRSGRSDVGA